MAEVRSPTVRRRELGALLRSLRVQRGFTVEQVAAQLLCSSSKISRLETGQRGVTARDARDLCDLYDITDQAERDRITRMAREGRQSAWWQSYDLVYRDFVGFEAEAVEISTFHSSVVPGLLQTTDYARAGHEGTLPRLTAAEIERQIEVKLRRQQRLTGADPPVFAAVLDEAVLHRMTGGAHVMRAQLDRLVADSRRPNVTVQVLPFALGAHPGVESNFDILGLPPPSTGVIFVEGLVGSIYLDKREDLDRYRRVFEHLQRIALSPKDSIDLIVHIRT